MFKKDDLYIWLITILLKQSEFLILTLDLNKNYQKKVKPGKANAMVMPTII